MESELPIDSTAIVELAKSASVLGKEEEKEIMPPLNKSVSVTPEPPQPPEEKKAKKAANISEKKAIPPISEETKSKYFNRKFHIEEKAMPTTEAKIEPQKEIKRKI